MAVRPSVVTRFTRPEEDSSCTSRRGFRVALEGTFHMTVVIPRFTVALLVRLIL